MDLGKNFIRMAGTATEKGKAFAGFLVRLHKKCRCMAANGVVMSDFQIYLQKLCKEHVSVLSLADSQWTSSHSPWMLRKIWILYENMHFVYSAQDTTSTKLTNTQQPDADMPWKLPEAELACLLAMPQALMLLSDVPFR